jgi:hypothetical protein
MTASECHASPHAEEKRYVVKRDIACMRATVTSTNPQEEHQ